MSDNFSVIVPCYDEPLREMLKNLAYMDGYFDRKAEFLVMENGSTHLYKKFKPSDDRIRYFHRMERGLGWALREGLRASACSEVYFLPADLSYDLCFVEHAKGYLRTGYDLVIGSKGLGDSEVHRPFSRKVISGLYNASLKLRYGFSWPSDITGVKAYRKRTILPLLGSCPSDGIFFEVELMKALRKSGLRSKEIAVSVKDFRPSHFNPLRKDTIVYESEDDGGKARSVGLQ